MNQPNRILVAGSYPPVPGEAAAATVAAVRRAWASGAEAVVAAPRPSAASYVLSRVGSGLGAELVRLGRRETCNELALCIEPGWPFLPDRRPGPTAAALAAALRQLGRSQLIITGPVAHWSALVPQLGALLPFTHAVTASSSPLAEMLARLVVIKAPVIDVVDPYSGSGARRPPADWPPVGTLEPGELLWRTRARRVGGRASRNLLGSHAAAARAGAARLVRGTRRAAGGP